MARDWPSLAKSGGLEKLKVGDLKEYLKEHGLSQTGEKGTLIFRIKAHLDGSRLKIDGVNPAEMKPAALKKACAQRGLSPMGYPDELLESLITYLKAHPPTSGDGAKGAAAAAAKGGGGGDDEEEGEGDGSAEVALVHRILALSEAEEWGAILSLGATGTGQQQQGPLTRQAPTAVLRKAYHRLSLAVHPDKLRGVPEATRAFQAVVTAFERLSSPEEEEAEKGKKAARAKEGKTKTIARSNVGCHRTRIFCPRCKEEWGLPIQGLPEFCYNYFQQGLKTYTCSTCLLEFGCLTAIHRCPHCRRTFEYDPHDYHRHITCGNKGCTLFFGFYCFPVSDRVEKEMREQLKAEQEARLRAREAKLARLARSHKRQSDTTTGGGGDKTDDFKLKLQLFVGGLLDECPRCGESPDCAPEDKEGHRAHLRACKGDEAKAQAYQARVQEAEKRAAERETKRAAQEDLQSLRTWEFLGGKEGDMWLLTDDQLEKRCREKGLLPAPPSGEKEEGDKKAAAAPDKMRPRKEEMIARLVAQQEREKGPRRLTDGTGKGEAEAADGEPRAKKPRRAMARDSLPSSLHAMSVGQLKGVCAAHGWQPRSSTQAGIIKEVEKEMARAEGDEEIYLLEE